MDERLTIAVILGSQREGRQSEQVAQFVAKRAAARGNIDVLFADPSSFTFPHNDVDQEGQDPKYTEITAKADGFFIITPEYNHSFPGTLKRMLDSEYDNYLRKPVALAGVSNGQWGGVRAVEALLPALRTLGLVAGQTTTYFPKVQNIFDEQGAIREDFAEKYARRIDRQLDELIWLATALKWGRTNLKG